MTLYQVAVRTLYEGKPQREYRLVMASDKHEALDKVAERIEGEDGTTLYDEEIQRAIADGELKESRIERSYQGYLEEREYID